MFLQKNTLLFLFCFACFATVTNAQHEKEYGANAGLSYFIGDVGEDREEGFKFASIKPQQIKMNVGVFFRYRVSKYFAITSNIAYANLVGDDKNGKTPYVLARNLNFRNNIFELSQSIEANIFQLTKVSKNSPVRNGMRSRVDIRLFVSVGFGGILFSPTTELDGVKYKLRPLQTEAKKYGKLTWTVPIGIGFGYTINRKTYLGVNLNYHFTGTDYLDDVSGFYNVNYQEALKHKDKPEFALANRTPEVQSLTSKDENYNPNMREGYLYDKNTVRGSKSNNDGYLMLNVTVGAVIKGKNKFYRGRSKALKGRRKVSDKRTRAKF